MKAQGLPISTIILIVIGIVVLAAVLLFFFTGFGKPTGSLTSQQALSECQSKCQLTNAKLAGRDPNCAVASTYEPFKSATVKVEGTTKFCSQIISCNVEGPTVSCSMAIGGCVPLGTAPSASQVCCSGSVCTTGLNTGKCGLTSGACTANNQCCDNSCTAGVC